ncbi:MAG: fluoride efflux transporter CrcB [Bauldia sp.]|nr:fluoride efflux transporter CrcB [Bauldia sp.]
MTYLIVFLGAGIGGAMRHGVNLGAARWLGVAFPSGTLIVNVVGGLAMGIVAAWFMAHGGASQHWRLFLTTGILGGFTTFSAFSLDAVALYERGAIGLAVLYVAASVVGAIAALAIGLAIGRAIS